MSDACLDTVIAASAHELEDAAATLVTSPGDGEHFARALARARNGIDAQLASLPTFDFYAGMIQSVSVAPSVVLGELPPGVGKGEDTGGTSGAPYLYIGAALTIGVLLTAMIAYFEFGGQLR